MVIYVFYYLNIFLVCSGLGYVIETLLKTFIFHGMNNGILFGPWVPVYGFGAVIIILIERLIFNRVKASRVTKIFLMFISVTVLLTLLEFLGGILIEFLFHKVFWDYSNLKFNFGHYIALEISLLWGIMSLVFIYIIKPIEEKFIKKIPKWITILVFSLFILDVILTCLLV